MTPEELRRQVREALSEWGTFRAGDGRLSIGALDEQERIERVEAMTRAFAIAELERIADLLWDDPGPAPQYLARQIEELRAQ